MSKCITIKIFHTADYSIMHIVYDLIGLNIVLTFLMLVLVALELAMQNVIAIITKLHFVAINYRKISKLYVCFLLSGLLVGAFFFFWWEWQSSECAFGYGLLKYSKYCFEEQLNIFPVGLGTLLISQFSFFAILLLLLNRKALLATKKL